MIHMNIYKAFLIKELMRNQCIAVKDAVKAINEFVTTSEGILGFKEFRASRFKLYEETKPGHITKSFKNKIDDLDIIAKQRE